ncbi:hypothetical protein J3R30DRAFT_3809425 [Lentinula aciculospora]|uniref:Uncharacterized protein n=1 Tax=Lentinula aciculospora TaxID=153920 RepID=A0A9W8ZZM6_9AGAR|nr:hypothetical protein J3R30DRAFT_3809425 [Lentinula aciculospora]
MRTSVFSVTSQKPTNIFSNEPFMAFIEIQQKVIIAFAREYHKAKADKQSTCSFSMSLPIVNDLYLCKTALVYLQTDRTEVRSKTIIPSLKVITVVPNMSSTDGLEGIISEFTLRFRADSYPDLSRVSAQCQRAKPERQNWDIDEFSRVLRQRSEDNSYPTLAISRDLSHSPRISFSTNTLLRSKWIMRSTNSNWKLRFSIDVTYTVISWVGLNIVQLRSGTDEIPSKVQSSVAPPGQIYFPKFTCIVKVIEEFSGNLRCLITLSAEPLHYIVSYIPLRASIRSGRSSKAWKLLLSQYAKHQSGVHDYYTKESVMYGKVRECAEDDRQYSPDQLALGIVSS